MVPPMRNTQVRGPLAVSAHARKDPEPLSWGLVLSKTPPPRPPTLRAPPPCAPGKAATGPAGADGWTPLPVRAICVGEFVALLATNTLPLTDPVVVGAKFTLNVVLCPAPKLIAGKPLIPKPAPLMLPPEMLTLVLPVLDNLPVWLLLLPTVTFPKLRLVGLAVSCIVVVTPVRLRARVVGEVGALLTSVRAPVVLVVVVGVKLTVKAAELPGATVSGS